MGYESIKGGGGENYQVRYLGTVHREDLSAKEQGLIIPQMMNYLEKYNPDMTFDKYKV